MTRSGRTGRTLGLATIGSAVCLAAPTMWLETRNGGPDPESWWYLAAILAIAVPAAVLTARRPGHPVSWLMATTVLLLASNGFGWEYARYAAVTHPGALPLPRLMAIPIFLGVFGVIIVFGVLVPLVFPTGRPPSPGWRWPAWAGLTGLAVFFVPSGYVYATAPLAALFGGRELEAGVPALDAMAPIGIGLMLSGVIGASTSLIVRFHRSTGVERAQLKWFMLAASVLGLGVVLEFGGAQSLVSGLVLGAGAIGVPMAVTVALLRYRLYDIDRIVSRTVAYTLIAAAVGLVYALPVLLLPRLFGGSSDLVVATSTLVAAAAFNPIRRRLQRAVDRRFDRARYDAQREIDALSLRLRSGTTLERVTTEVGNIVRTTLGPHSAAIWIREPAS